jgi:aspartate/aromatic aminotransferase
VIEELESQNIFVIKFDKGIRIGICSVPKRKIVGLAKKIKEAIEKSK